MNLRFRIGLAWIVVLALLVATVACMDTPLWNDNPPAVRYLIEQGWSNKYAADNITETGTAIALHAPWYWWNTGRAEWVKGSGDRRYLELAGATIYDKGGDK